MLHSKGKFFFIFIYIIHLKFRRNFFTKDDTFFRKSLNCFLVIPTGTRQTSLLISVYNVSIFIITQIFFKKLINVMIGIVITMLMHFYIKVYVYIQGFPKETHVSQKFKNIGDPLSDDKEGKISTFNIQAIGSICRRIFATTIFPHSLPNFFTLQVHYTSCINQKVEEYMPVPTAKIMCFFSTRPSNVFIYKQRSLADM